MRIEIEKSLAHRRRINEHLYQIGQLIASDENPDIIDALTEKIWFVLDYHDDDDISDADAATFAARLEPDEDNADSDIGIDSVKQLRTAEIAHQAIEVWLISWLTSNCVREVEPRPATAPLLSFAEMTTGTDT